LAQTWNLAGASSQNNTVTTNARIQPEGIDAIRDVFESFLDSRSDDSYNHTPRHLRHLVFLVTDDRYRYHLAIIIAAHFHVAVKRLQALGMGHRRGETDRQISGNMQSADWNLRGVYYLLIAIGS